MRGVLLVVDYPGRREESRVANLRLESAGWDVRHLLDKPSGWELTGADYAGRLIERHGPFGPDVAAVLAYCMAAPIAQEIAAALSGAAGRPLPLVLFDGEPSTGEAVERELGVARAQLGGSRKTPDFSTTLLETRPAECVERMRHGLVRLAADPLRADGADDEEVAQEAEQVAAFYLDWLVYLVAARNTSWPGWRGEVCHIVSRTHLFTRPWPGARVTRLHRVDSGRNELLDHPHTRELALSFLDPCEVQKGTPG